MLIQELKTIIDRIEGEYAVLTHHGEQILWPKEKLPSHAKEGDVIVLVAKTDKEARHGREELAKSLINDILKKD